MADLPQLPGITVTGVSPVPYDYTAALYYQLQLNEYLARQGATTAHDPYVPPGGYNSGQAEKKPPPAPPAAPAAPADPLELTYNPDTGEMEPPTWAMNDAEYAEHLGGGDAAYEQMWEERHPGEELPGLTDAQPGDPGYELFAPPMPAPITTKPGTTVVPWITRFLPWLAPFVPLPAGPQLQDETPLPPRLPPGAPPWFDPIMPPNWNDIAYEPREFEIGRPAPGPVPTGSPAPGIRPGIYDPDPEGLPYDPGLDEVELPTQVITAPRGRPAPIADFPLPDPFAIDNLAPYPSFRTPTDPRVFTGIPTANPRRGTRPRIDTDIGFPDAISIPRIDAPVYLQPAYPLVPDIFGTPDPTPIPVPGPEQMPFPGGPTQRADPCNCPKPKKRKKSEPRTVCYQGTYTEHSRGLTKARKRRVPCDSKGSVVDQVKRRLPKSPSLPDLAKDVFGIPY